MHNSYCFKRFKKWCM